MSKASILQVINIWLSYKIPIGSRRILHFRTSSDCRIRQSEIVGSDIRQLPVGIPGDSIRPVDPVDTDRIRRRITSESDILRYMSIGSDLVFVGFPSVGIRPGLRRKKDPIGSDRFRSKNNHTIRWHTIGSSIRKTSNLIVSYMIASDPVGNR